MYEKLTDSQKVMHLHIFVCCGKLCCLVTKCVDVYGNMYVDHTYGWKQTHYIYYNAQSNKGCCLQSETKVIMGDNFGKKRCSQASW